MFKTIFMTISATLIVVAFVLSIFLNSILGLFGYTYTTIEAMKDLNNSKHIVEKMRKRHEVKKTGLSKKYVKRSSKKIASSAVASVTIGTAGVATIIAGLEVHDYCEERKELHEDNNILYDKNEEFTYGECLNDAKEDINKSIISAKEAVSEKVKIKWEDTKDYSSETWATTKEMSNEAWDKIKGMSYETWDATKEISSETLEKIKEISNEAWGITKEKSNETLGKFKEISSDTIDAATETTKGWFKTFIDWIKQLFT